jgi:hypothetical protein
MLGLAHSSSAASMFSAGALSSLLRSKFIKVKIVKRKRDSKGIISELELGSNGTVEEAEETAPRGTTKGEVY